MRRLLLLLLALLTFLALLAASRCLTVPTPGGCFGCRECATPFVGTCEPGTPCCACVCGSGCGPAPSDWGEWSGGEGWCRKGKRYYGGTYLIAWEGCSASDYKGEGDEGRAYFSGRSWRRVFKGLNSSVVHRVYWDFVDHADWRAGDRSRAYARAVSRISVYGRVEGFRTYWFGVEDEEEVRVWELPWYIDLDVYMHNDVFPLWDCVDAQRDKLKLSLAPRKATCA